MSNQTLYLLIGGNQGDREQTLARAAALIGQQLGEVAAASRLYETEPWGDFAAEGGGVPQNFLNQALAVETALAPHECLRRALSIESALGRDRSASRPGLYASRPIDIDLIFYGTLVVDTPDLTLPHPRMHLRRFVLLPLCEIAPQFVHPLFHKPLSQLTAECADTSFCSCCS